MVRGTEGTVGEHMGRKTFFMFAVIAVAIAATAFAVIVSDCSSASITDDWSYDFNTKVLTYSGPEKMPDYEANENPITVLDAKTAQSVYFFTDVTKIGDYAFKGSSIHDMTVPSGVKSIGKAAFAECHNLKTLSLPNQLTSIGDYAFISCSQLQSVSIPSNVVFIGKNAFHSCSSMKTLTLPEYDPSDSQKRLAINERTFYDCSSLETLVIPQHVTEIGSYAFSGCSSLYSLTFQETEITDGEKTVIFDSEIRKIGDYAFSGCSSLRTLMIPDKLTSIGTDVFKGTSDLKSIDTRGTNQTFRSSDGVLFDLGLSVLYHYPSAKEETGYIIPSSTIEIRTTAFDGAKNLQSLAIGQSDLYYSEAGVLFDIEKKQLIRYPEGRDDSSYTIPDTVSDVCTNAFTGALYLKDLVLTTSSITFRSGSLCIGSYGNYAELHVSAPGDYKIPESAYNSYTSVYYGGGDGGNSTILIIAAVCAAVLLIAVIAIVVIRRRRI